MTFSVACSEGSGANDTLMRCATTSPVGPGVGVPAEGWRGCSCVNAAGHAAATVIVANRKIFFSISVFIAASVFDSRHLSERSFRVREDTRSRCEDRDLRPVRRESQRNASVLASSSPRPRSRDGWGLPCWECPSQFRPRGDNAHVATCRRYPSSPVNSASGDDAWAQSCWATPKLPARIRPRFRREPCDSLVRPAPRRIRWENWICLAHRQ